MRTCSFTANDVVINVVVVNDVVVANDFDVVDVGAVVVE